MRLTSYCRVFPSCGDPAHAILFSTRTAAALLVPSSLVDAVGRGGGSAEERATLAEHGFLVESAEAERREMLGFLDELNALDRAYRPLVVLNLDCNLACAYCFEGTRKGRHYLSGPTAERLLRHLENHALPGREELDVTFYGGEPLLSTELILSLAPRMRALCDAAGASFSFSLITNGTLLTRERLAKLRPLGLRSASVTLDGPRESHDAARPFRSGAGSYDAILRNLRESAGLFDLQIGGNFTRENCAQFPRLLDDLLAAGLTPAAVSQVRFDPVFREREEIAPADFHGGCTTLDEPWLCEASVFLRGEILRRGYRTGRVMPSRCMMDVPGSPVINWDGALYPCPGLIGREQFKLGTLGETLPGRDPRPGWRGGAEGGAPGGRTEGSTTGVRSDRAPTPQNWHNEQCLSCAYLPLCFGGCRYLTLLRTGSTAGVDCRRAYFDAVLERLVLQEIGCGVGA